MLTINDYVKSLKEEMKSKNLSQSKLAELLGTSQSNVSFLLNGKSGTVSKYRKIEKIIKQW